MGRTWLIGLGLLITAATASAGQLAIVTGGKSDYVIGISHNPSAGDQFAAEEISRYIKQITGAELPIKTFDNNAAKQIAILPIGSRDKLGNPLNPPDTFFVMTKPRGGLWIGGTTRLSMLFASYRFLDELGCRFLSPKFEFYGGGGEIIPKAQMLSVDEKLYIKGSPSLRFRKLYVEEGHSHTPENLAQIVEWMPKVGFNTLVIPTNYQGAGKVMWDNFRQRVTPECQKRGITIEVGGHGYQNFLNAEMEGGKVFEQHPEWFGADASGTRHKEHNRVFCTSNPEAVDYLIKNFIAYVKDRPEIQIYDFWPPDGARWCECDNCKKLGGAADREAILITEVQMRVHEVRPDLRLEFLAYQLAITPPQHAKLDKSILVDFCPIGQQFDHQINDPAAAKNKEYADALVAWRKAFDGDISIYSYYRKYAWDSLPVIIPHYMQKDLQWYAKVPVQGVSSYSEPGDWATYELNHYVLAALAWDPNADVDALIKKFCTARYGPFADQAAMVLGTLEEITRNTSSIPSSALKSAEQIETDHARAVKLADAMAAEAAKADDPSVKRALERLNLACAYLAKDLEIQKLRATGSAKDEITTKSKDLHEWLAGHADDGVFLVKDQRISPQRMQKRDGAGGATKKAG